MPAAAACGVLPQTSTLADVRSAQTRARSHRWAFGVLTLALVGVGTTGSVGIVPMANGATKAVAKKPPTTTPNSRSTRAVAQPAAKASSGLDAATVAAARGEAVARTPANGEPYRLGFLLARKSDDAAILGAAAELQRGADLAVSFVNELGGIAGRPVALVVAEEGGSDESAMRGFASLTERGVYAVIGPTLSKHVLAVSALAEKSHTLLFGASTTANGIPGLGPWVRRSAISPDVMARGVATELVSSRLISTAVVAAATDDAVGQAVLRSYSRGLADAGIAVSAVASRMVLGQTDFSAVANEIASSAPDLVVVAGSPSNTARVVSEIRQALPRVTFLIDPTALSVEFSKRCEPCSGVLTPVPYDPEDASAYSRAVLLRRYFDAFGTSPTLHAAQGFAAVQILSISLDAAVARQSTTSLSERRNHLREAVGAGRYDTPFGIIQFDANGEVKVERIALGEIVRSGDVPRIRGLPSVTVPPSS